MSNIKIFEITIERSVISRQRGMLTIEAQSEEEAKNKVYKMSLDFATKWEEYDDDINYYIHDPKEVGV